MKKFFDFNFTYFRRDLLGGITAGIVALPLALAFGQQTDLGAAAGLFGAIFIGIFASLFGGTQTQISGPTAPMTAVSYLIINKLIGEFDGHVAQALPSILLIFLTAGLLQAFLGLIGLGKYIRYIPYPVVSGFMTGIGVIIIITQLFPAFGYEPHKDPKLVAAFVPQAEEHLLEKILQDEAKDGVRLLEDYQHTTELGKMIPRQDIETEAGVLAKKAASSTSGTFKYFSNALHNINWLHFCLVLLTIAIIYGFKKITTKIPSTLAALFLVTLLVYIMKWKLALIDEIPQGFPVFHADMLTKADYGLVLNQFTAIISLTILGSIDSLLTSVVADNMTKTRHNSNRELVGQGIGNAVAAFFGGLPGAGATIRTVVNINSGGKTRLSGMIAGLFLLTILLSLGPVASLIPQAVLAGILITVGIGVIDYKGLRSIRTIPAADAFVMFVVLVLTIFFGLIEAVALGMIISALVFMKKMGDISSRTSDILSIAELEDKTDMVLNISGSKRHSVYIKRIKGPLFFGVTNEIKNLFTALPDNAKCLIIDMQNVPYIDQSGAITMEEIILDIKHNPDMEVIFVRLKKQPRYLLERTGIFPTLIGDNHVFDTIEEAEKWLNENIPETGE